MNTRWRRTNENEQAKPEKEKQTIPKRKRVGRLKKKTPGISSKKRLTLPSASFRKSPRCRAWWPPTGAWKQTWPTLVQRLSTKCRNGSRLWLAQKTIAIGAFATKGRVATRAQHHEPTPRWNRDCHRSPNRSSCQWELFLQKWFRYVLSSSAINVLVHIYVAHREDQLIWQDMTPRNLYIYLQEWLRRQKSPTFVMLKTSNSWLRTEVNISKNNGFYCSTKVHVWVMAATY